MLNQTPSGPSYLPPDDPNYRQWAAAIQQRDDATFAQWNSPEIAESRVLAAQAP